MNIKFGMDNFYVRYLKRFLNHELSNSSTVLGEFDKGDLKSLIKYLNLPNVKTIFEVQKEIVKEFPQLVTLFNVRLKDTSIQWTSKKISLEVSTFLQENIEDLKEFCSSVGWKLGSVSNWVDTNMDLNNDGFVDEADRAILYNIVTNGAHYDISIQEKADLNLDGFINEEDLRILDDYIENNKLTLVIEQENRTNYFPNKDMLVFINQFDGTFLYNYAFRDGNGYDDQIHENYEGIYKVGLYECYPRSESYNST